MGNAGSKLNDVIFWGGPNKEKSSGSIKWDHDIEINFSKASKLAPLGKPEVVVSILTGKRLSEIQETIIYEGTSEYKVDEIVIEISQQWECTIAKIWGKDVNFKELSRRLVSAGAKKQKPEIEVVVPDRPVPLPDETVKSVRYYYAPDIREKDASLSRKKGLGLMLSNVTALIVFLGVVVIILFQVLVTRHTLLPLPPEAFVGVRGDIAGFFLEDIEATPIERMGFNAGLVIMKFAEDVEALGVDRSCKFLVPEGTSISNKLFPSLVKDSLGNEIYNIGARTTEFVNVVDFEQVNTNFFEVDAYKNRRKPEGDWSKYGELGQGNAKKILLRGGLVERDSVFYMGLARGYVKLGEYDEDGQPFYDKLEDNQSYVTALYALRSKNTVKVFGQIEKTFTVKEGRDSKKRMLFSFRASNMRDR